MTANLPTQLARMGLRKVLPVLAVLAGLLLGGCATAPPGVTYGANPRDPWESYNRSMTQINDKVYQHVLNPVATAYTKVVPSPVRTGVTNFFGNLSDAWSFINNLLQANPEGALYSFWRVAVNTTFGLGGLLDPATEMKLYRHRKDFGTTLGRWGMPPGPYLVLPVLGPSSLRDTTAMAADIWANPAATNRVIHNVQVRNSVIVLGEINTSAQLLGAANLLNQAALDPYSFTRDAWLQKRRNDIYNGNPPPEAAAPGSASEADEERYDQPEASATAAPAASAPAAAP
ncbi:MAG: VacJ family lipoprotein [Burkholderiaceae bacterium]|jgi:phospholipid-binding lipoprotein MlaA|nr:VacJ family lipoprotein [Burkholderiaceae bacterium]